ncbi:MAG: SCO family protein [Planctomycetota bacterium]
MLNSHRSELQRSATAPEIASAGMSIGEFDLIDQNGEPVDETILDGAHTVVSFIFTNCPGLCPTMTQAKARLQDRVDDLPVRMLSISLDAERDTPAVLSAFGERFNARFDSWTFATGDTAEARRIVAEDLLLVVEDETERMVPTADGSEMANILHPTRLILVGPGREILGFYSVLDASGLDSLEDELRSRLGS